MRSESDITRGIFVQSHSKKPSPPVVLLKPGSVREMYSAGVKMAVVARGEGDVYVNTYNNFSKVDKVTKDEFLEFYRTLAPNYEDDFTFTSMVKGVWGLKND